ncbi:serine/arginine repetitive matrix protein 1-like isoform X2 [Belonocnema kinseyi]|nr:serine/arginine repetitive matrix protein 1-like isoform X2 [Belonocnema kinseyi]
MLALPRPRMLELSAGKKETNQVVSTFNIKLKDFRNNMLPVPVKVIEDGSQKSKINAAVVLKAKEVKLDETKMKVEETIKDSNKNALIEENIPILKMAETKSGLPLISGRQWPKSWYDGPPRPSVAPKNCSPPPQRRTFNAKPKCFSAKFPKINQCPLSSSDPSKGRSHLQSQKCSFRKKYSSKSKTDLPKPSLNNNFKSSPIRMEKSPSGFAKDKGQSRLSLMVSVEVPRLRTTKSLPDQIVSRYSSGVAEPGLIKNFGNLGSRVSKSSNQVAHMSSGNGRKNRKRKRKKDCQKNQESPPPCSPPPPPPCCPPPPPCSRDPGVSSKPKKKPCSSPPEPCGPKKKTMQNKKNSCDDWCPQNENNDCYTSKCPKRKKMSPKPRICPPNCFEPDPCKPARSFCVHPKKKGGKSFSTWAHQNSGMLFTYRTFASDPCKPMKKEEENMIRRIPKPGPVCKETAAKNKDKSLKAALVEEPKDNKCKKPPEKSSEPSLTSEKQEEVTARNSLKQEKATAANPLKRKFEEVQKSFVSDPCRSMKKDAENVIRRIPKPGPVCKQAASKNGNNSPEVAPLKKPVENKCKEPPRKSCQSNSTSGQQVELTAANLLKREFEEVQKCKQGKIEVKSDSNPKDEQFEENSTKKIC